MNITLDTVVFGVFAGLIIGSVLSYLNSKIMGECVRKLMAAQAFTPESARSLRDAGCRFTWLLRLALHKGGNLRHVVYENPAVAGAYYIAPSNHDRAQRGYVNRNITVFQLVVFIVALIAVMILVANFLPDIVILFTDLVDSVVNPEAV